MLNEFEFLNNLLVDAELIFNYSEVTMFEIDRLISLGFEVDIKQGRVVLDNNRNACARLILDDIYDEDYVQDVLELRFFSKENAIIEIENIYIRKNKTFGEIVEDLISDWQLSDIERTKKIENEREYIVTSNYY